MIRSRDRLGDPTGWKLKPLLVKQGAHSRVWTDAAKAIASTRLLTLKQAHAAVALADADADADAASQGATP